MAKGGSAGAVTWVVVENKFPQIADRLGRDADAIVRKTAMDIEAHAKMAAPVDTGILRASIQAAAVAPKHWRVTVGAEYGIYLEMGTRFMAPRPYFNPAIQAVWPAFQAAMRTVMG